MDLQGRLHDTAHRGNHSALHRLFALFRVVPDIRGPHLGIDSQQQRVRLQPLRGDPMELSPANRNIRELRSKGYTLRELAEQFGISRARVWQITRDLVLSPEARAFRNAHAPRGPQPRDLKRDRKVVRARQEGQTLQSIADVLHVSRQRVFTILKRMEAERW